LPAAGEGDDREREVDGAGGAEMRSVVLTGTGGARRRRGRFETCGCRWPFGAGPRCISIGGAGVMIRVEEQDDEPESRNSGEDGGGEAIVS
jgi:hypothetical protein